MLASPLALRLAAGYSSPPSRSSASGPALSSYSLSGSWSAASRLRPPCGRAHAPRETVQLPRCRLHSPGAVQARQLPRDQPLQLAPHRPPALRRRRAARRHTHLPQAGPSATSPESMSDPQHFTSSAKTMLSCSRASGPPSTWRTGPLTPAPATAPSSMSITNAAHTAPAEGRLMKHARVTTRIRVTYDLS